jgi:hypothetical protein
MKDPSKIKHLKTKGDYREEIEEENGIPMHDLLPN